MPKYSVFVIRGCSQTCSILAHSQANTGSAEGLGTCQVAFNAEQLNDYAMDLIKFTAIQLRFRTSQLSTLGSTKFKIKFDLGNSKFSSSISCQGQQDLLIITRCVSL